VACVLFSRCLRNPVTEALGCGSKRRLVIAPISFHFALRRGIEAVGDHVEQRPGDLLREQINLTSGRIKGPLQGDSEALLLGAGPVIGEIKSTRALISTGRCSPWATSK
jgi:hypothetical protein